MGSSDVQNFMPYNDEPGSYTAKIQGAGFAVWEEIKHHVMKAIDDITYDIKDGSPFRVAEFGANDGGTSMPLMKEIIEHIRKKHGDQTEVEILYEDQPFNDFTSLFLLLTGSIPGPAPFLPMFHKVFVTAVGKSFHEQCFASNSIQLGISANSLHFLNHSPCPITDVIHPLLLGKNDPRRAQFAEQVAREWETFLLCRAAELKEGGVLVLDVLCSMEHPSEPGVTDFTNRQAVLALQELWRDMLAEEIITQDEWSDTNFLRYSKSLEELQAPFQHPESPVMKAGLRLTHIEKRHSPAPYFGKTTFEETVKCQATYMKSFLSWPFLSPLSKQRTQRQKEEIVNDLLRRYETLLVSNAAVAPGEIKHAYIVIQKTCS